MTKGKGPLTKTSQTSRQHERDVAKSIGGRAQPNSGATPWAKQDIKDDKFLYQHKDARDQKGHRINFEEMDELRRDAIDENRVGVYWIEGPQQNYFLMDESTFNACREYILQEED